MSSNTDDLNDLESTLDSGLISSWGTSTIGDQSNTMNPTLSSNSYTSPAAAAAVSNRATTGQEQLTMFQQSTLLRGPAASAAAGTSTIQVMEEDEVGQKITNYPQELQQQQSRFPNQMQQSNPMQQVKLVIPGQFNAGNLHQQQPGGVTDLFQKVVEEGQGVQLGNHQLQPLNKEEMIQQQTFSSNTQQMHGPSQGL
jgi:hypothetical protein